MYLNGSKWSYNRRRRRGNPFRIMFLVALVAGALYVNQVVVPATPPLFVPTPTPTRAPESFVSEAETFTPKGSSCRRFLLYKQAIQADPQNPSNHIAWRGC
jgi:hypothetical protein